MYYILSMTLSLAGIFLLACDFIYDWAVPGSLRRHQMGTILKPGKYVLIAWYIEIPIRHFIEGNWIWFGLFCVLSPFVIVYLWNKEYDDGDNWNKLGKKIKRAWRNRPRVQVLTPAPSSV